MSSLFSNPCVSQSTTWKSWKESKLNHLVHAHVASVARLEPCVTCGRWLLHQPFLDMDMHMHWTCIGHAHALDMHWICTGHTWTCIGLHWICIGQCMHMHWTCTCIGYAHALDMDWACSGHALDMHQPFYILMHWTCTCSHAQWLTCTCTYAHALDGQMHTQQCMAHPKPAHTRPHPCQPPAWAPKHCMQMHRPRACTQEHIAPLAHDMAPYSE